MVFNNKNYLSVVDLYICKFQKIISSQIAIVAKSIKKSNQVRIMKTQDTSSVTQIMRY